jgi:hypothetical protein
VCLTDQVAVMRCTCSYSTTDCRYLQRTFRYTIISQEDYAITCLRRYQATVDLPCMA